MAIDTEEYYNPKLQHPIYVKIALPEHNDYTLWNEYEIRILDEERSEEGPFNYLFEAILIGKEQTTWEEIPALLKGFAAKSKMMDEIKERIHPLGAEGNFSSDDDVIVLYFLRKGQTKNFITTDTEVLHPQSADTVEIKSYTDTE